MFKLHNGISMNLKLKIWLERNGKSVLGMGRLDLLKAIDTEGSISKAAKRLNISFRRAWSSLESAEKNMGIKLLDRKRGGAGGGRTTLTPQAILLIDKFEKLLDELKWFTVRRFKLLFGEVMDNDFDG